MFALIRLILLAIIILSVALFVRPDLLKQFGIAKPVKPVESPAETTTQSPPVTAIPVEKQVETPVTEPETSGAGIPAEAQHTAVADPELTVPIPEEPAATEPMPETIPEAMTAPDPEPVMEPEITPSATEATEASEVTESKQLPVSDTTSEASVPVSEESAVPEPDLQAETTMTPGDEESLDTTLEEEAALIESILMKEISETFDTAPASPATE